MVVLEGEQGTNKSSALRILAVREEWFSDNLHLSSEAKQWIESILGRWLVEAAELSGLRKGDVEGLKASLSRQVDQARMSYDRLVTEYPRQCVIIGTTNAEYYLRDGTGNRRFWPVRIEKFDLDALRRDRDQLWAEAVMRESAGESIRLDPKLWETAAEQQQERAIEDPFISFLSETYGDQEGKLRSTKVFDMLGILPHQRTQDLNARVGATMAKLGFKRKRLRFGGGSPVYTYVRGTRDVEIEPVM